MVRFRFQWLGAAMFLVAFVMTQETPQARTPGAAQVLQGTVNTAGKTGAQLYGETCAACHGFDGKGKETGALGFDVPTPDFTDCNYASREPDADWVGIAHEGGPARGFSKHMPAFGGALSEADLYKNPASSQVRPLRSFSITPAALFEPADTCMVCHNNLVTRAGEDVSIFTDWRASMMANSSRDPYWMAAVRREVMDHPADAAAIEDECSVCHMPMTTFPERAAGRRGRVFDRLPAGRPDDADARLAADGVSCTVCHQIQPANLGTPASFSGNYVIDVNGTPGARRIFGPFLVDSGRTRVMRSASGFEPTQSTHMQQSELCATCHTLFTRALTSSDGMRLPEQMPYQEWRKSAYKDTQSCQSCHMPVVEGEMPLTQVLGQPREGVSRHTFRGGNFFMMTMLNRYRAELGVRATPHEMDTAVARTVKHLQEDTARIAVTCFERVADALVFEVEVENLAGHKLPTAYPSRRGWLHLTVTDAGGRVVFESGAFASNGRVVGNDNDADATTFEPHYAEITRADQVQVYESRWWTGPVR